MPYISVQLTPPLDVIEAMNDRLIESPMLMARGFRRAMLSIAHQAIDELKVEPPDASNYYPLPWKSERQRRYVMWLLKSTNNLPYQRTHDLSNGWDYDIDALSDGGEFTVFNTAPEARFVVGDSTQPMFFKIPWPQAAPILSRYREQSEEVAIQVWYTVSDPFAGVNE